MKKILITAAIISSFGFFSCDNDSSQVYYVLSYTLTRNSDSTLIADGEFTAGPDETGHEGLPAASLYTSDPADSSDDQYVFLVTENIVDYDAVENIIGGWSNSNDGVWFSTEVNASGPGTYACSVINAKIGNVNYQIETTNSGIVVLRKVGDEGSGTIHGTVNVIISNAGIDYTFDASFNVKRGSDDTHMTN